MDFKLLVEQELYEASKKCTGPTKLKVNVFTRKTQTKKLDAQKDLLKNI